METYTSIKRGYFLEESKSGGNIILYHRSANRPPNSMRPSDYQTTQNVKSFYILYPAIFIVERLIVGMRSSVVRMLSNFLLSSRTWTSKEQNTFIWNHWRTPKHDKTILSSFIQAIPISKPEFWHLYSPHMKSFSLNWNKYQQMSIRRHEGE